MRVLRVHRVWSKLLVLANRAALPRWWEPLSLVREQGWWFRMSLLSDGNARVTMARNVQLSISLHNLLLTPEMRVAVVIVNAGHPASRERDDTDEAVPPR